MVFRHMEENKYQNNQLRKWKVLLGNGKGGPEECNFL